VAQPQPAARAPLRAAARWRQRADALVVSEAAAGCAPGMRAARAAARGSAAADSGAAPPRSWKP
jgi:hypothetical protein